MRKVIYTALVSLPAKTASVGAALLGLFGTFTTESIRKLLRDSVTAENIQFAGMWLLAGGILYFALLWLLKPGESEVDRGSRTSQTNGHNFVEVSGPFNGPVSFNYAGSEPPVPNRSVTGDDPPIARDVGLEEALAYAALGEWGRTMIDVVTEAQNNAIEHLERFQQMAADGSVAVWGRRDEWKVFERIPQDHWLDYSIDFLGLISGVTSTRPRSGRIDGRFVDLMVSKAEFERLWPHEPR